MSNLDKIIKISKELGLAHIGSSLTAYPIIEEIFRIKKPDEKFVLSNGHAALALAVVMHGDKAIDYVRENMHASSEWCDASTGSLGHGIGIAVGMAIADRTKKVYCLLSDGECSEGSVWESLRVKTEQKLDNLVIHVNCNGWASYSEVDVDLLEKRILAFCPDAIIHRTKISDEVLEKYPQLENQGGHYSKIQ